MKLKSELIKNSKLCINNNELSKQLCDYFKNVLSFILCLLKIKKKQK